MTYRSKFSACTFGLAAVNAAALAGAMLAGPAQARDVTALLPKPAVMSPVPTAEGVLRMKSAYGFDETVERLKADVNAKGIRFFIEIDQSQLGAVANIALRPSKLLIFGNPPLGVQFLTSNPYAGLDWPVRMLVTQDAKGDVYVAYTDFGYIARRYAIRDRGPAFKMAEMVSASIASSVGGQPRTP
jgi:uncharacterized protein (DUF302 family)